jgi:glycosyltransferase involved in cell wall biosynthesis
VRNEFYLPYLQENGVVGRFLSNTNKFWNRFHTFKREIKKYHPDTIISYSASPSMISCMLKILGARFNLIVSERSNTQKITKNVKLRFFLYHWANYIVPNSYSQGAFIEKHFHELTSRIKVITNFVNTDKFSPSGIKQSEKECTEMLCVGRMWPEKNIPRMIKAIKKVVADGYNIKVDWYGQDLKDDASAECYNALHEQKMEHYFVFHAPSQNIQEEYQKADVFCLPSLYEGFPNVLCEAMSSGKPVLCSRVCDNPNIVSEGENGFLFNPLDVEEIASTIEHYLDLPKEKKFEMGKRSREIAVNMFSESSFIQKYINIL